MVTAVLYSDQVIPANERVNARLCELLSDRGNRIGYIASGPDPSCKYFLDKQSYYRRRGLALECSLDPDTPCGTDALGALLGCSAIHLSGGHTAGFLARLRRAGLVSVLRDWAIAGGVLIGTSAGAILLTPNIAVDALFDGSSPEETEEGRALGLVPFDFFPHVQLHDRYLPSLVEFSRHSPRPIIGCPDGDGVIVEQGHAEGIGEPICIWNGSVTALGRRPLASLAHEVRRPGAPEPPS